MSLGPSSTSTTSVLGCKIALLTISRCISIINDRLIDSYCMCERDISLRFEESAIINLFNLLGVLVQVAPRELFTTSDASRLHLRLSHYVIILTTALTPSALHHHPQAHYICLRKSSSSALLYGFHRLTEVSLPLFFAVLLHSTAEPMHVLRCTYTTRIPFHSRRSRSES